MELDEDCCLSWTGDLHKDYRETKYLQMFSFSNPVNLDFKKKSMIFKKIVCFYTNYIANLRTLVILSSRACAWRERIECNY